MIVCLANVLSREELVRLRADLAGVAFVDGASTAGWHAREVKHNLQARAGVATAALQAQVTDALRRHPVFELAARSRRVAPALFSRYEPGMAYGTHVDDAIMKAGDEPLRADIALTLFVSGPDAYSGGELTIETTAGTQRYKLDAGCAVLYPASTLHRVEPVTRGERLAAVTWIHSLVRDPARRELLFDLDTARRALFEQGGKSAEFDLLSKTVSNLLRMWAEV